ncbi:MAG: ParB/RepB/Spo0J family partition protein [Anaerolineaceae bacterium]
MVDLPVGYFPAYLLIDHILPNPEQPRKKFDEEELLSLSESIKAHGVLNPIAVSAVPVGDAKGSYKYTLIDGERRLRAAKMAGLEKIPVMVHGPKQDDENLMLAMVGNLQRSNLNPIEEGNAYKRLKEMGWTYTRVAREAGVSYQVILHRVSLLNFDPAIQTLFANRRLPLSPNVVIALNMLPDSVRTSMAMKFAMNNTSLQRIEMFCRRIASKTDAEHLSRSKRFPKSETPSLKVSDFADSPSLQALSAAGSLPAFAVIKTAAQETCEECAIRDSASLEMCQDCPAILLMKKIHKASQKAETASSKSASWITN